MKKLFMSLLAVASIGIAGFANAQETAAQSELGSIDATITTAKGGVVTWNTGAAQTQLHRGVKTQALSMLEGINEVEVSFTIIPKDKWHSFVEFQAFDAGVVKELWINGIKRSLNKEIYPYEDSMIEKVRLIADNEILRYSGKIEDMTTWNNVRMVISGVTPDTSFGWAANPESDKTKHGFCISNVEMKVISTVTRENTLRIMT